MYTFEFIPGIIGLPDTTPKTYLIVIGAKSIGVDWCYRLEVLLIMFTW